MIDKGEDERVWEKVERSSSTRDQRDHVSRVLRACDRNDSERTRIPRYLALGGKLVENRRKLPGKGEWSGRMDMAQWSEVLAGEQASSAIV